MPDPRPRLCLGMPRAVSARGRHGVSVWLAQEPAQKSSLKVLIWTACVLGHILYCWVWRRGSRADMSKLSQVGFRDTRNPLGARNSEPHTCERCVPHAPDALGLCGARASRPPAARNPRAPCCDSLMTSGSRLCRTHTGSTRGSDRLARSPKVRGHSSARFSAAASGSAVGRASRLRPNPGQFRPYLLATPLRSP